MDHESEYLDQQKAGAFMHNPESETADTTEEGFLNENLNNIDSEDKEIHAKLKITQSEISTENSASECNGNLVHDIPTRKKRGKRHPTRADIRKENFKETQENDVETSGTNPEETSFKGVAGSADPSHENTSPRNNDEEIKSDGSNEDNTHDNLQNELITPEHLSDRSSDVEDETNGTNTQLEENLIQEETTLELKIQIRHESKSLSDIPKGIRKIRTNSDESYEGELNLKRRRQLSETLDDLDLYDDLIKSKDYGTLLKSCRKCSNRSSNTPIKKVTFKEEDPLGELEKIPVEKLDSMTIEERFQEYSCMLEKALSLKERSKYNQAANIFEAAVDILNPLYFQNTPNLMPKVKQELIRGYNYAAACRLSVHRYSEACKDTKCTLKLDPENMEAMYYYGVSKVKIGDFREAARMFLIAKRVKVKAHSPKTLPTPESTSSLAFRKKILVQLRTLRLEHPELDFEKIKEEIELQSPKNHRSRRWLIIAAGGLVSTTVAMYMLTKKSDMPQKRRLVTSISTGIFVGAISFLLDSIFSG